MYKEGRGPRGARLINFTEKSRDNDKDKDYIFTFMDCKLVLAVADSVVLLNYRHRVG